MDTITVETPRVRTHCWVQGPLDGEPLLLVHGNLCTGRFWQALASRVPDRFRIVAPDLRSFGRTEALAVDASRGLRDWSDDVRSLVEALDWGGARLHAAGWSLGGGVLQQYEIDHPSELASLTLIAPISPFGFGGTRDAQGTPSYADFAGSGGGTAAPDFVRRLATRDASEDEPMSSPRVVMRNFFWSPRYVAPDEDELIQEVLLTSVGDDFYPGTSEPSPNWPGVRPAPRGVNNAFSPAWCNTSAFGDVDRPAPLLWIRGDEDQVISDESMFDFGTLGKLGAVPGWPGEEVFPPQPQMSQTRLVFERRQRQGGVVREIVLHEVGHGPLIERPDEVARLMLEHIDAD
ncbi:MAG: alpha/beta hydrolase [Chloroflexi bacterium]|nr:alpha/beta hydrolase [Chloroflexota bacterium]